MFHQGSNCKISFNSILLFDIEVFSPKILTKDMAINLLNKLNHISTSIIKYWTSYSVRAYWWMMLLLCTIESWLALLIWGGKHQGTHRTYCLFYFILFYYVYYQFMFISHLAKCTLLGIKKGQSRFPKDHLYDKLNSWFVFVYLVSSK